jgi:hypothetical protein
LLGDGQRFIDRNRPLCDAISERGAFDQLKNQRTRGSGFFEAIDRSDVRMVERGQDVRFSPESRQAVGIVGEISGRTLIATSRFSFKSRAR